MQVDHLHGGKLLQHAARRQRVQAPKVISRMRRGSAPLTIGWATR
jgi:hypothetical protein